MNKNNNNGQINKDKPTLSRKIDLTVASLMTLGLVAGQLSPLAVLANEDETGNTSATSSNNKILGINVDFPSTVTNTYKTATIVATLDEGYSLKCDDESVEIKAGTENYTAKFYKNGVYTFSIVDSSGTTVGESESVTISNIDTTAIIAHVVYSQYSETGSITLQANSNKNYNVSVKYKKDSMDAETDVSVSLDSDFDGYRTYSFDASVAGVYYVTIKNLTDNTTKVFDMPVYEGENEPPVINDFKITPVVKNKEYLVEFDATDDRTAASEITAILYKDGNYFSSFNDKNGHKSISIFENGNYEVVLIDKNSAQTTKTFTFSDIDDSSPEFTFSYNHEPAGFVGVNIVVSNETHYTTTVTGPNGSVNVLDDSYFEATTNGDYLVTVTDDAGNSTTNSLKITNVVGRDDALTVDTNYDASLTNSAVSVSFIKSEGVSEYEVYDSNRNKVDVKNDIAVISKNGRYTIYFRTESGIMYKTDFNITNIDSSAPEVSFNYLEQTIPTEQQVQILVKDDSEYDVSVKLANEEYYPVNENIYSFTVNGIYIVTVTDLAGNVTTELLNISTIGEYDPEKEDVTFDLEVSKETYPYLVTISNVNKNEYTIEVNGTVLQGNTYEITRNGTYTFKVTSGDKYLTKEVIIDDFSEIEDKLTLNYDSSYTNKDVKVSVSITADNPDEYQEISATFNGLVVPVVNNEITVSSIGLLVVTAKNSVTGKTITESAAIDNINKDAINPIITYEKTLTRKEIPIEFTFNDGRDYTISVNGYILDGTNVYTCKTNGLYSILITDIYGNQYSETITINNIKESYLEISDVNYESGKTGEPVFASFSVESSIENPEVKIYEKDSPDTLIPFELDGVYDGVYSYSFEFPKNGEYIIQASADSLTDEKRVVVDFIDLEDISFNIEQIVDGTDSVTVLIKDINKSKYQLYVNGNEIFKNEYVITKNGEYEFSITDEYGHSDSITIYVSSIKDFNEETGKERPTINYRLGVVEKTNQDFPVDLMVTCPDDETCEVTVMDEKENSVPVEDLTFIATSSQIYTATVTASNGESNSIDIEINNLKKGLNFDVDYPDEYTTEPVSAVVNIENRDNSRNYKITVNDQLIDGFSFEITKDGTYVVVVSDDYGNTMTKEIEVSIFSKSSVQFSASYDSNKTNKDVTVSYNYVASEPFDFSIKNSKGESVEYDEKSKTFIATKNDTYTLTASIDGQVISEYPVIINNINKEMPVVSFDYFKFITSKNINLTINVSNKDSWTATVNGFEAIDGKYLITANGEYKVEVIDDYGNKYEETIVIDNKVDSPLTIKASVSNKAPTNESVFVDLEVWSEDNLDYEITMTDDEETPIVVKDNQVEISKNGSYSFNVKDSAGNIANIKVEIKNINKEAPIIEYNEDDFLNPASNEANLEISVPNKSHYWISLKNNDTNSYLTPDFISGSINQNENGLYEITGLNSSPIYKIKANGEYTAYVVDEYGNESTKDIVISNLYLDDIDANIVIDLETPVTSLKGSVEVLNRDDFELSIIDTEIQDLIYKSDGPVTEFTIEKNGTYVIEITDKAGNFYRTDVITVTNIDKESPEIIANYNHEKTNKDIIAEYTVIDKNYETSDVYKVDGINHESSNENIEASLKDENKLSVNPVDETLNKFNFKISENGTYVIKAVDALGHTCYKVLTIDNINKELPLFDLSLKNTDFTRDNAEIQVDVKNKNSYTTYYQNKKFENNLSVSQNGTYYITVVDDYGNSVEKSITVKNIDKTSPTLIVSYSKQATNKDVVVNVTAHDSVSGVHVLKVIDKSNNKELAITNNQVVISNNTTIEVIATDKVGNTSSQEYIISSIDKVSPEVEISYNNKTLTNKNVPVDFKVNDTSPYTIYINGYKINGTTYYAAGNQTYKVMVVDEAGNITEKSFSISNIDKTSPTISLDYSTELTEKPITVKYNAEDSNGISHVTVNGRQVSNGSFEIEKNGKYVVSATDNAGNVFTQTLDIKNIDLEAPKVAELKVYMDKLKTYLSIKASDDASGVKAIKFAGIDVTKIAEKIRIYQDGLYEIEVIDNLGKSHKEIIRITDVRLRKYLPCAAKLNEYNDKTSLIDTDKEDANIKNPEDNSDKKKDDIDSETKKDGSVEIKNKTDKIIFRATTYDLELQNEEYVISSDDLITWYGITTPEFYAVDFIIPEINFSVDGLYAITANITAPDGTLITQDLILNVGQSKSGASGNVAKVDIADEKDESFLSNLLHTSNPTLLLIGKIGLGIVAGAASIGAIYYAVTESKKRAAAHMLNVLIIINGKPYIVERVKRSMNTSELTKHLTSTVLPNYFKNSRERIKVTSISFVDEDLFSSSEKVLAATDDCGRIIYVNYIVKEDLR